MLLLKTQSFLQALSSISLGGILKAILGYIFLAIDSVVYFFVSQGFKMYIALAQFKLFDDKVFDDLINRTYIIIGVIALFIVAYALLNSIINPDNASKGDKSLSKIVKNFIFAIIGIAIVPTIFNYFYYFQRVVLCNNLIPKILLAQKGDDSQADLLNDDKIGTQFATYLFQSFFYPKSIENMNMTDLDNDGDLLKSEAAKVEVGLIDDVFSDEENVNIEKYKDYDSDNKGNYNLQMAYEGAMNGEMFFTAFRPFLLGDVGFANSVLNNTVNYMIIVSTIAGVYCAYVLASLCIDMAIRAVKLGYLELIAPLPIMTLIIPGKDGVFKAWIKKTGSCAFEVFTRLFIVSFVIYLIRTIPHLFTATSFSYSGCTTSFWIITALLIRALVYCGLLTFLKQAPKFLSEATGIKSDGFKLGIASKLADSGLFTALGAAGGAVTAGVRNLAPGVREAKGFVNKARVAASNLPSGVAGFASGAVRGFKGAKDAKKWSDVSSAAGKAADDAIEAKLKRQDYKNAHGGTVSGAIGGHIQDAIDTVKDYPNSHRANYAHEKAKQEEISKIIAAQKAIDDKYAAIIDKNKDKIIYGDKTISAWEQKEATAKSYLDGLSKKKAELVASGASQQDIDNIDIKINAAQDEAIKAHSDVVKATRETKNQMHKDITKIKIDEIDQTTGKRKIFAPKAEDNAVIAQLYADYNSMLKSHVDALSGDQALYKTAQTVLSEVSKQPTEDAQKAMFRQIIENQKDNLGNDYDFIGKVKVEAARVTEKMNQEGEAARKQQEGKK